jgi:hypothetical protein
VLAGIRLQAGSNIAVCRSIREHLEQVIFEMGAAQLLLSVVNDMRARETEARSQ